MKFKIKLLKDWGEFKADSILEVDEATKKELIDAETAEDYDAILAKQAKDADIKEIVVSAIKEIFPEGANSKADEAGKAGSGAETGTTVEEKMAFKSLGDQLNAVALFKKEGHKESGQRLDAMVKIATAQGLNEAVDSEGGFLVQTDIQADLESIAFETGILAQLALRIPVSATANAHEWMAVKDDNRTDGNRRGGITVKRLHEATAGGGSKPKFERRRMVLEKLEGHYFSTEELLQDVSALTTEVGAWFGEEFGFVMDDEMIRGTGAGEMLGILNSDALVTVAKESGQTLETVNAENVEKMFQQMWPNSVGSGKARWYINQEVQFQLWQMQHTVGTGGLPVFLRPSGIAEAPFGMLLGVPIVVLEQATKLGEVGYIILADFSQYKLVEKGGITSTSSIHVRFLEGETVFKFTMRNNGQPKWRTSLTPANARSGFKVSPFVTLAIRD